MNAYAKIAIKVGVVIVLCLILLLVYNVVGHRAFVGAAKKFNNNKATQVAIETKILSLLEYQKDLPTIRQVQYQDMQTIRNLIPDADEFKLTSYLRVIHGLLADNHLATDGIAIGGSGAALGGTDFKTAFSSDITALQQDLEAIVGALQMFRDNKSEMNNMLVSFNFYKKLSTEAENFRAIAGGIETHSFNLTVRGSYTDIKKFTYDIFNMRPHTALINFQMAPQGAGFGQSRQYSASFRLVTYGDANEPPPLWIALNQGIAEDVGAVEDQPVDEEKGEI